MVRIREQQNQDDEKEYIYTIKKRDNKTNLNVELENKVEKNY